jgi:FlaA1/EpsC-like NDP-sugar epimerase
VELVIQAGAIGRDGEALVLDMGKPVVIAEVARLLAARSDRRVSIEFTGLRPGEKLHEVLLATGEVDCRPAHPLISQVPVPSLDPARARSIDLSASCDLLIGQLARLAADEVAQAPPARRALG